MKIIQVRVARSIWLIDLLDLNPRGKDIAEYLIRWLQEKYDFKVAPDPRKAPVWITPGAPSDQSQPSGIEFQHGRFQSSTDAIEVSKLTLYSDGIVVDSCSSTSSNDELIHDLLKSGVEQFDLVYNEESLNKRLYLSELIVGSELSLDQMNPRLSAFSKRIEETIPESPKPQFRIAGFSFWSEPTDAGTHRIFTLEPQSGKPFASRRYYSRAPLATADHFRLLTELEEILR